MSTRLKERGGAKIIPDKSAAAGGGGPIPWRPAAAGKENPRSLSRGRSTPPVPVKELPRSLSRPRSCTDKPSPIITTDKPRSISRGRASAAPKVAPPPSALRWSTSSVPVKGKTSTVSSSSKMLAEMRSERGVRSVGSDVKARVDAGSKARDEKLVKGVKALENRKMVVKDGRNVGGSGCRGVGFGVRLDCSSGKSGNSVAKVVSGDRIEEVDQTKNRALKDNGTLAPSSVSILDGGEGANLKASTSGDGKMSRSMEPDDTDASLVELRDKVSDRILAFENAGEQKVEEGSSGVVKKYPSKLHEKLAMLEGKVQRIASEIKMTKEMLDLNNSVESKLILTDIQNKISGIEKAVGHAATEGSTLVACPSESSNVDSKGSTKGLNYDELEARFFPHHKLIRSQTSQGSSGGNKDAVLLNKHDSSNVKDGSESPIDENPVALEFLASLNAGSKNERILKAGEIINAAAREIGLERISSSQRITHRSAGGNRKEEILLMSNENLDEFEDQENQPAMELQETSDESPVDPLVEIGRKSSTGGWFVSEGEAVLLAHDDGSCSFYDMANLEVKAEYKPPTIVANSIWNDCWLIRAPGPDGCSGRYVIAASAGNSQDSGFCSWDFYTKDVKAFHIESEPSPELTSASRSALAHLSHSDLNRRSAAGIIHTVESPQWWYRPCGPLLISTASRRKTVSAYDIRDGDLVMNWEVDSPVLGMEYSSPLQWRSRGKIIIAETEKISLWDVNSLNPQPLVSVPTGGKKVYSLHVNNTDAELGGGVRQRVTSSEVEGNDGVFCTQESINVFDFRLPSGVGLKMSRSGASGHAIFTRGDSVYIGCSESRLLSKASPRSQIQHFSLRKGRHSATYVLPDFNTHIHQSSLTQVWGNSNMVMGICGMGLFVFDAVSNDGPQSLMMEHNTVEPSESIGPDDLYSPTFDYLGSRVLFISRDRPASWKYLS